MFSLDASQFMEKLSVKKCVVVSVGLYPGNAKHALARAGPVGGDVVFLVNSEPRTVPEEVLRGGGRRRQPMDTMEAIHSFINELDSEINIVDVWLDPRDGLVTSVAKLRSLIEGYAPCRVIIGMAGGFRWLSTALMFLALAWSLWVLMWVLQWIVSSQCLRRRAHQLGPCLGALRRGLFPGP